MKLRELEHELTDCHGYKRIRNKKQDTGKLGLNRSRRILSNHLKMKI
jgi:hypothetical protein